MLQRGNVALDAPASVSVPGAGTRTGTPERHLYIPTPERGNHPCSPYVLALLVFF